MPENLFPPTIIRRTVFVWVFDSSSAYLSRTRRVTPPNFCGQWQFSQVSLAGTRRLLSRAEGIGFGLVLSTVSISCRMPLALLLSQPDAPGATWHSTHSTRECGEF